MSEENYNVSEIMRQMKPSSDGGKASMNRMDPAVLQAVMSMAQLGKLTQIHEVLQDTTSRGWTFTLGSTFSPFVVRDTDPPGEGYPLSAPAQSISIANDGPNSVLIGFNDFTNPYQINRGESFSMDFGTHMIKRLLWKAVGAGSTANIRVIAKG